ncbi:signal recognition particle-docking protein FtsY [Candidatus Sumerlaeota bacterium]|nr:signal recognition particle-docking protein FtsY [Candidatus Sumerlaeota bacterium]
MAWFFNRGNDKDEKTAPVSAEEKAPVDAKEVESTDRNAEPEAHGLFGRMKAALAKTRNGFVDRIREVIKAASGVDENLLDSIEEILIKADLGAETTFHIIEQLREFEARGASPNELLQSFKDQLYDIVAKDQDKVTWGKKTDNPLVILVVGVNGTGKTTTIGKLAAEFTEAGKKVLLAAGDTFRAAAIEQLEIWSKRTNSAFVSKKMGSDPSGVAYEACERAIKEGYDVVLIDTAGRLHTKVNLMEELKKIVRVIQKVIPNAPHETLLVLDATTGQNAIQQAKVFSEDTPLTGLVLSKLDGTAKGGVLIGIRNKFDIPVIKIGVGEGVHDLRDFDAREFIDALFAE